MRRIKFVKGGQRKFIKDVLSRINCPNLRSFEQFGMDIPYSTLKNYYSELRNLPEDFFENLCYLAGIDSKKVKIERLNYNFGQSIGGKKSKRICKSQTEETK